MKDPAQCVAEILNVSPIHDSGWSVIVGALPTSPDTVVLVNHTGGTDPYPHLLLNFVSVQVMVRGKKSGYVSARAKIGDVVDLLLGMAPATVQGDLYRNCIQLGEIGFLGQDDNTRDLFSANFRFIVEPATNALTHRSAIT